MRPSLLVVLMLAAFFTFACEEDTGGGVDPGDDTGGQEDVGGDEADTMNMPDAAEDGCEGCEFTCCEGRCTNTFNDHTNCGECGNACTAPDDFCQEGICGQRPCTDPDACEGATPTCCGDRCCGQDQICCALAGPVGLDFGCADGPICPIGCATCDCAAPDTPIATPSGERAIATLEVGDLVYSVDHNRIVTVPIARINRTRVVDHSVVRATMVGGEVLEISAGHPTADGRTFADLKQDGRLDGALVRSVEVIPYPLTHTYDILPASSTGTYFANGLLIGSTLSHPQPFCGDGLRADPTTSEMVP